jgi:ribosome-associated heat shock protein Hsp15
MRMDPTGDAAEPVRIDRWLWAARLFKTRALAVEALKGGRVEVNGRSARPSREVRPGDALEVATGPVRMSLVVRATSVRRGPAAEAAGLYDETPESRAARERAAEERRLLPPPVPGRDGGRPTKRDRRRMEAATGSRRRRP